MGKHDGVGTGGTGRGCDEEEFAEVGGGVLGVGVYGGGGVVEEEFEEVGGEFLALTGLPCLGGDESDVGLTADNVAL